MNVKILFICLASTRQTLCGTIPTLNFTISHEEKKDLTENCLEHLSKEYNFEIKISENNENDQKKCSIFFANILEDKTHSKIDFSECLIDSQNHCVNKFKYSANVCFYASEEKNCFAIKNKVKEQQCRETCSNSGPD